LEIFHGNIKQANDMNAGSTKALQQQQYFNGGKVLSF